MNDILRFMSGLLPLIEEELDVKDPDKIGPKTSKYIKDNINPENSDDDLKKDNPNILFREVGQFEYRDG